MSCYDVLAAAIEAVTPAQRAWLCGQGVTDDAFWRAGGVGAASIRWFGDTLFEVMANREAALLPEP